MINCFQAATTTKKKVSQLKSATTFYTRKLPSMLTFILIAVKRRQSAIHRDAIHKGKFK